MSDAIPARVLCHIDDIEENASKGISLTGDSDFQEILLVKRNGEVYAYKNSCPHTGASMNWQPDEFMDIENFFIICAIHGALFSVENGYCVRGPCAGQSLQRIDIEIQDGKVLLTQEL